jgi:hypothetical protein
LSRLLGTDGIVPRAEPSGKAKQIKQSLEKQVDEPVPETNTGSWDEDSKVLG